MILQTKHILAVLHYSEIQQFDLMLTQLQIVYDLSVLLELH